MALQYQQNDDHNEQADERLVIAISPTLRIRLKRAAAKHDLAIDQYVEDILEKAVAQEEAKKEENTTKEEYRGQHTLERLRRTREQIMQDRQGQPFDDSTEIIRQMREERSQYLSEL